MIPFFVFNGVSSKDMGIIVNKLPPISKAEKNYEELEIPGRNGKLFIDKKCYKPFKYEITCTLMPNSNIRDISAWLDSSGKLIISTELDKFYEVIIKNQIDFAQAYKVFNEFVIIFEVQPIAFSVEDKKIIVTKQTDITILRATYDMKPYIKVNGNGNVTLTINNKSAILKEIKDYIELDCELEEAYKNNKNCNSSIECEDFPKLIPGKNSINWIGNVSSIEIKYKEAFL